MNTNDITTARKERRKKTLQIGNKVRVIRYNGIPLFNGEVCTIVERCEELGNTWYGVLVPSKKQTMLLMLEPLVKGEFQTTETSVFKPFYAEDLELIDE